MEAEINQSKSDRSILNIDSIVFDPEFKIATIEYTLGFAFNKRMYSKHSRYVVDISTDDPNYSPQLAINSAIGDIEAEFERLTLEFFGKGPKNDTRIRKKPTSGCQCKPAVRKVEVPTEMPAEKIERIESDIGGVGTRELDIDRKTDDGPGPDVETPIPVAEKPAKRKRRSTLLHYIESVEIAYYLAKLADLNENIKIDSINILPDFLFELKCKATVDVAASAIDAIKDLIVKRDGLSDQLLKMSRTGSAQKLIGLYPDFASEINEGLNAANELDEKLKNPFDELDNKDDTPKILAVKFKKGDVNQKEDCLAMLEEFSGVDRDKFNTHSYIVRAAIQCMETMVKDEMDFYVNGAVTNEVRTLFEEKLREMKIK